MSNTSEVYNNIDRKRELVESLKEVLEAQFEAAEALDTKAWNVLSVTSATLGIASSIQVILIGKSAELSFWIGLAVVLFLYLWQVREVLAAVKPLTWHLVPGVADGEISFRKLMEKYVGTDESTYLNKLIVDYAGKIDPDNEDRLLPGAIQVALSNNVVKKKHIIRAARLLGAIIAGLIIMAVLARWPISIISWE